MNNEKDNYMFSFIIISGAEIKLCLGQFMNSFYVPIITGLNSKLLRGAFVLVTLIRSSDGDVLFGALRYE